MNRWLAIGLGTVALVAAVGLYFAGHVVPAGIALAASMACDAWFVVALRNDNAQKKTP